MARRIGCLRLMCASRASNHEDLFTWGTSDGVWPIETIDQFHQAIENKWAVVKVDLSCPMDYLKFYFDDFLRERGIGKRGPHKAGKWILEPAKYPLASRANIRALNMTLKVYDLRRQMPEASQWEIGVEAKVNLNQIPRRRSARPDSDQRRVLTATVSRYLRRAGDIIRNVEVGVFPKHD
jgi:hypothetical protein